MQLELIQCGAGNVAPDLVLKNAKIFNVFSGQIIEGDIAIKGGYIAGVGCYDCENELDLSGKYVTPGFIDSHVHIESSMVIPQTYCANAVAKGTTTFITDPHEIANVRGIDGIRFMLDSTENIQGNFFVQMPSCVPCTTFEHAFGPLTAQDLLELANHPRVLGLGEVMDFVSVLNGNPVMADKIDAFNGKPIDGHAPLMSGKTLQGYICSGVQTDHEATSYEEALEKLQSGISVLVRLGSSCKNVEPIIQGVVKNKIETTHMAFCTDDKHFADIKKNGTILENVQQAVALGLSPMQAVQMATINAARIYKLNRIGAIAAGYKADILVFDDIKTFKLNTVLCAGKKAAQNNQFNASDIPKEILNTVKTVPVKTEDFALPTRENYPVISIVPGDVTTNKSFYSAEHVQNMLANKELCKISVIERHHATGNMATGLLMGYGLNRGAVASTVGHDSHNIIVAGVSDEDMLLAVQELERIGGGYVIANDGEVVAELPLAVGGLMSIEEPDIFEEKLSKAIQKAYSMGVNRYIDPFITLSFMALPVIPHIRITDMGIFDVDKFQFI